LTDEEFEMSKVKLDFPKRAYSGYILCERGFGSRSEIIHAVKTAANEIMSLVLSAGPDTRYGVRPGDYIAYQQGTDLKMTGPNGGQLFMVPENMIGCIEPREGDHVWPRPKAGEEAQKPPLEWEYPDPARAYGKIDGVATPWPLPAMNKATDADIPQIVGTEGEPNGESAVVADGANGS
jgi:hypothetical protein